MALASSYAISGLSQAELYSTTYGPSNFLENPISVNPLCEYIPSAFVLDRRLRDEIGTGLLLLALWRPGF